MRIGRRSVLKGLAASYSITVLGRGALAQASGPSDAAQIDVAKAKAEGKVRSLHEPRHANRRCHHRAVQGEIRHRRASISAAAPRT